MIHTGGGGISNMLQKHLPTLTISHHHTSVEKITSI